MKDRKRYDKQRYLDYGREYYLEHNGKERIRLKNMNRKGENCNSWKGGKQKHSEGYILIWVDSISPFAKMRDNHNCIPEHRLAMAEYLGRCLGHLELVHHINGIKTDNRVENLELMSKREHAILNNKMRPRDKLGRFISFKFTMEKYNE